MGRKEGQTRREVEDGKEKSKQMENSVFQFCNFRDSLHCCDKTLG